MIGEPGKERCLLNILLFGATGMLGQGVLRECLRASDVALVRTVGRRVSGRQDPKLQELIHRDFWNYASIESALQDFDACFFCLGVSAFGMSEAAYTHMTFDLTLAAAQTLARLNPRMTFVYLSAAGADSSERGRIMWARIRGRTENALRALPFKAVYVLRPGLIQPLNAERSRTAAYRLIYGALTPLWPMLRFIFRRSIVTTQMIGRAMLALARDGSPEAVLEAADIGTIAAS